MRVYIHDFISHRPVMRRKSVRMTTREKPPTDAVTTTRTWPWSATSGSEEIWKENKRNKKNLFRRGKKKKKTWLKKLYDFLIFCFFPKVGRVFKSQRQIKYFYTTNWTTLLQQHILCGSLNDAQQRWKTRVLQEATPCCIRTGLESSERCVWTYGLKNT